jgi:hypothetical protein
VQAIAEGLSVERYADCWARWWGVEAMFDPAAVASNFERMVRIADGTGIPLGERSIPPRAGFAREVGARRDRRAQTGTAARRAAGPDRLSLRSAAGAES